jgi:RHS repeat-associated protein
MFGGQRVAMRQGDVVYFIHSDHLGSTSLTTDITGTVVAETRYLPYGEERWITGTLVTDFTFTGQRAERGFALMDYNARYYDPGLGRFVSADTVVPEAGSAPDLNRYSYVRSNPLRYIDPTGHLSEDEIMQLFDLDPEVDTWENVLAHFEAGGDMEGRWGYLGALRDFEPGCNLEVWWDDIHVGSETYWTSGYSAENLLELGKHPATQYGLFNLAEGGQPDQTVWYDATRKYYHVGWDANRVDWIDAGIDIFGIIGDAAGLFPPAGTAIWAVSEVPELMTVGKAWDQLDMGDPSDVLVDVGVGTAQAFRLVPEAGFVGNAASLTVNLSKGVYITP